MTLHETHHPPITPPIHSRTIMITITFFMKNLHYAMFYYCSKVAWSIFADDDAYFRLLLPPKVALSVEVFNNTDSLYFHKY